MTAKTTKLMNKAISNAISGLSGMVGKEIQIFAFDIKNVKVRNVAYEFGGPESLIVGVYLQIKGRAGHMFVGYEPKVAADLITMLLGQAPVSMLQLSEMEQSVLGEVGNLMGSFFLNALAEGAGMSLLPSPPAVMVDMAGAILDVPLSHVLEQGDETPIIAARFGTPDKQIEGKFLIVPIPAIEEKTD
jgi:chemotaxis protein CheC